MIGAFLVMALGALTFVEQDIPGIEIEGPAAPVGGQAAVNYRLADLDGDGTVDLVLPTQVFLQRGGRFLTEAPVSLPEYKHPPLCDVWGAELYLLTGEHLDVMRRTDDAWAAVLSGPLLIAQFEQNYDLHRRPGERVHFERFLHDLDGDGVPEIVVPESDGIHLFAKRGAVYGAVRHLDVFPPLRCLPGTATPCLWPGDARSFTFPARAMACTYSVYGSDLTVVSPLGPAGTQIRYRIARYRLDPTQDFAVRPDSAPARETAPMYAYLRPCSLNDCADLDFAGVGRENAETSALGVPLCTVHVCSDGKTQVFRAPLYPLSCPLVDVNGDGAIDVVTESCSLYQGGLRETVSRFLTATSFEHDVAVFLQGGDGSFSKKASYRGRFPIELSAPPARNGERFRRYQQGRLVSFVGDFNKDGLKDVVVQHAPNRLAVYLNASRTAQAGTAGFQSRPEATIPVAEDCDFAVADVDGDGRSDVVLTHMTDDAHLARKPVRVFFAREAAP